MNMLVGHLSMSKGFCDKNHKGLFAARLTSVHGCATMRGRLGLEPRSRGGEGESEMELQLHFFHLIGARADA